MPTTQRGQHGQEQVTRALRCKVTKWNWRENLSSARTCTLGPNRSGKEGGRHWPNFRCWVQNCLNPIFWGGGWGRQGLLTLYFCCWARRAKITNSHIFLGGGGELVVMWWYVRHLVRALGKLKNFNYIFLLPVLTVCIIDSLRAGTNQGSTKTSSIIFTEWRNNTFSLPCWGNLANFGTHFWYAVSVGCFTVVSRGD